MGNTPNVRFKGFTEDWEQRKFGDLGSVAMCKRVFKEQTTPVGEIPFYKIGTFGVEPDAFISRELFEEYKSKFQYPNVGDMLISASGTIGRTVEYSGEEAYFQDSNIVWFKHDDRIDNSFLRCIYNIVKWNGIEGSTIKRLYNDNFLKTEFYMPTTGEQAKIGAYFRSLDHLITLHQQKCDETKEFKKYMLQNMFPQKDEKVPKIRFAGFTGDWEQRKFSDIAARESSISASATNIPSVEYEDVVAEEGRLNKDIHLKEAVKSGITFDGSQVLYGKLRPYLHNWLNPDFKGIAVGDWWVLKPINMDKKFLYRLIQTQQFDNIANQSSGSKMPRADWNLISNSEFMIPFSKEEQSKIGRYFDSLDHLITLHQQKCNALKEFKKYMLQNMFPQKGENKCQN